MGAKRERPHRHYVLMVQPAENEEEREATKRYVELQETFASEPCTRPLFAAILEARDAPDDQEIQLLALCHCLAEAMGNPFIPAALYNGIAEQLTEIQNIHTTGDEPERQLRAGFFVPMMIAASKENTEKENTNA